MAPEALYTKALQRLLVLAAGESPSAEDRTLVAEKYASLHEMLLSLNLANWTVSDDIPDDLDIPMTAALAYVCGPSFAAPAQMMMDLAAEGALGMPSPSLAERQLRKLTARTYSPEPAAPDYF